MGKAQGPNVVPSTLLLHHGTWEAVGSAGNRQSLCCHCVLDSVAGPSVIDLNI